MSNTVEKVARVSALVEFRKKHFEKEMERNLEVLKEIRDNNEANDKDKTLACNAIAHHVGGLRSERTDPTKKDKEQTPFSEKQQKDINDRISAILNETPQENG